MNGPRASGHGAKSTFEWNVAHATSGGKSTS